MVVIEALFGAARAFFQPAYTGLLPQTISESLIQDARALTESTANVAILVGPALGTVLVLGLGAGEAFALDAATFLLSAALLVRVHARPRGTKPEARRESVLHELRGGWREVRSRPWVWVTIAAFAGAVLCGYAQWYALAPSIAKDLYGHIGLFGVLESVAGGGAVIGAVVGIRWRPARPLLAGLLMTFPWPLESIAFALGAPIWIVLALSLTAGFGFSLFGIWWETALVRHIPAEALSRVSAYDWMGSLALLPLGFAIAGPLAAAFGARNVLALGAVLAMAMIALAIVPRSTRELSGEPSAEELARNVGEERGGEAEIAHVDSFIGAVNERRGLQ
jgi:hypothetical protein